MGGTGETESADRKPKRASWILWLLAIGLLVYVVGVIIYSYGWHKSLYFNLGEDRTFANGLVSLGQLLQISGLVLVFQGLVFLFAGFLKGVPRMSLISVVLGVLAYGIGYFSYSFGSSYGSFPRIWLIQDLRTALNLMEWGRWTEALGVALIILGLLFYVAERRKKRGRFEGEVPKLRS